MNKTLVAAMGGVTFGIVLCASVMQVRMHSRQFHCQRMQTRQIFIVPPAAPPPVRFQPPVVEDRSVSACAPESQLDQLNYDQRLSVAQTEYVMGRFDCSMRLARAEIPRNPERAYRILGAAACNTGNVAVANEAYSHLHGTSRQYLRYVCQHQAISQRRGHFVAE